MELVLLASAVRKYKWATADFPAMSMYLSDIDWMQVVCANPSGSSMWSEFTRLLTQAIDAFVPSFVVSKSCKQSCKPRRSRAVRKLDAKKRRLWKCLLISPHDFHLRQL